MSVMPDLLLQAAPEVKSKAKPAAKAPEPSKNESSSFDKVYAKERQVQSGERTGETRKVAEQRSTSNDEEAAPVEAAPAEPSEVAADGKTLPVDGEPAQELDPLLAMAMALNGGAPLPVETPVTPEGELDALPGLTIDTLPPQIDGGEVEPAVTLNADEPGLNDETPDALANLQMQVEEGSKAQTTASVDAQAKSVRPAGGADFSAAMASTGVQAETSQQGEEPSLEIGLETNASDLLESLKDSSQPNRPDQFINKLSALTQAINQQSGVATRVPVVPGQPLAINQGGWSEAVVDKVMWMSSQNLKSAEIQLDPADLGRLEVRVHLSQDAAQVTFASPNAGVRDALEGQMHRLRDLFAQQGMNLSDANVSDQSLNRGWQGQSQGDERGGSRRGDGLLGGDELISGMSHEVHSERTSMGRGLVDYYA